MSNSVVDQWLNSGTARTETVELFADQAIMDEMRDLIARRDILESQSTTGQRAMGEANPMRDLERDEAALWARYEASKSTWIVRALTPDETEEIRDEFPEPMAPQMLPKVAPAKAKAAWAVERDAFVKESERQAIERDLHFIAKATISITTGQGATETISVAQVRAMRAREYGPDRIEMLTKAIAKATRGEVEMPRPKSLSGSEGTKGQ